MSKRSLLPGVGLRFEFENRDGDRIGVVARRTGDFEVVVYPRDDPDQAQQVFRLTDEEAEALAQILGAPRIAERFAELTREVPGLNAGQVAILARQPVRRPPARRHPGPHPHRGVDRRDRPGRRSSRLAGARGDLRADDVLVVIGTEDGIAGVEAIVAQG